MDIKEFFVPTKHPTRYPAVVVQGKLFHDKFMHYDALEKAFKHFTSSYQEREAFADRVDSGEISVEFGYLVNDTFEVFDEKKSAYRRKTYVNMCVF